MVELDSEGELTRGQAARFLREFADEIDDGTVGGRGDGVDEAGDGSFESRRDDEEYTDETTFDAKRITLIVGGDSATVTIPEVVEFDVEVESRSPMLGSGVHQGIEFELSWEIENPDELDDEWIEVE